MSCLLQSITQTITYISRLVEDLVVPIVEGDYSGYSLPLAELFGCLLCQDPRLDYLHDTSVRSVARSQVSTSSLHTEIYNVVLI